MTCKDCVHDGVCFKQVCWKDNLEASLEHKGCESFTDKSRFVELPCKIGDKVYKLWGCGKRGKSVAEFEVMHFNVDYLPEIEFSFRKSMLSGYYYFAKASDIGKTVFLTREEAEAAIKEKEHD